MTRPLVSLPGAPAAQVLEALASILAGEGPAILPHDGPLSRPLPETVPQRTALVIETSGSTDRPKRVALSADALLASAAASDSALGGPGQWLLALPATYIAGINVLVRSIAAQTTPVLLSPGHFDPVAFVSAAHELTEPLRYTSLVPAQLSRLLDAPGDEAVAALKRFDRILVGGQATPPNLLARCAALGIRVTRTYGSSETSGGCVYDGVPIGQVEARVVDGEIQLAGPVLAEGYLDDPERSEAAFVVHTDDTFSTRRWYRTGDTGTLTDGLLAVSGRLDDVIISGGLKVSLGELETAVRALPGLHGAVVISEADERWGEVPVVVSDVPVELARLRSAVTATLGRAAAPARVVVAPIPLMPSGKPDRRALRAAVRTASDR
jgi:O-succinylbenzoic acid--CoA ligase